MASITAVILIRAWHPGDDILTHADKDYWLFGGDGNDVITIAGDNETIIGVDDDTIISSNCMGTILFQGDFKTILSRISLVEKSLFSSVLKIPLAMTTMNLQLRLIMMLFLILVVATV